MKSTMIKVLVGAGLVAGMAVSAFAGDITFNWDNDALTIAASAAPFYIDQAGTTPIPVGQIVDLIAVQAGTNVILATAFIGGGGDSDGQFNAASTVASNLLEGVKGLPMGFLFFNGASFGAVSNATVLVPTPDYAGPPPTATSVEVDWTDAAWKGNRTDNGGFYLDVPEPSSIMLVGMGFLGFLALRRRHS